MRLVFVHDGPLFYDKNGKYHEFSYHGLYERYSYLADEIVFLMRTEQLPDGETYNIVPDEIKVVGFQNFKSPKRYFKYKGAAEKTIAAEIGKADIAVLRDSTSSDIALKYVKKKGIPYIHECVGCNWDSMWNHGLLGKVLAPYAFFKAKRTISEAPYVYYVTNECLQRRYPTKGVSVGCSNVVIQKVPDDVLQKRVAKIKAKNKDDLIILGTAAAIDVRYKGQEHVIRAIKGIEALGYRVEYRLAGGNRSNSTFLKELAISEGVSDRVRFLGSLSSDKMSAFYDELDVYIQPSKQEGLPRSVIEAMSRGCPVIGTKVAGIPELIQAENLFRKGSDKAVIEVFSHLMNEDILQVAKENFNKAKEYTDDILTARRKQFYDCFMKENGLSKQS